MRVKPSLVINSSPLIALAAALPDFQVLECLVERLIVPQEVMDELNAGGLKDNTASLVNASSWCEVRPLKKNLEEKPFGIGLGRGESAVIQIALEEKHPYVVIDEVRGRRAARLAGLKVIGSLGILVELFHAKLLSSFDDSIVRMQAKGIFLSNSIIELAREEAMRQRDSSEAG